MLRNDIICTYLSNISIDMCSAFIQPESPAQEDTMADSMALAEAVRNQCIAAALRAYEEAGISGLCAEGRWELAIQAIRTLDLNAVTSSAEGSGDPENDH